jgi:DNA-binding transcriptional MocR family regulator
MRSPTSNNAGAFPVTKFLSQPFTQKIMHEQNKEAIAYGCVLAILMTSKQPAVITVATLASRLQLTQQEVTTALNQLEANGRISQIISRTIVQVIALPDSLPSEVPNPFDEAEWEKHTQAELDAEAAKAKAARKGTGK